MAKNAKNAIRELKNFRFLKNMLDWWRHNTPYGGGIDPIFFLKLRISHKFFVWKFEMNILIIAETR